MTVDVASGTNSYAARRGYMQPKSESDTEPENNGKPVFEAVYSLMSSSKLLLVTRLVFPAFVPSSFTFCFAIIDGCDPNVSCRSCPPPGR